MRNCLSAVYEDRTLRITSERYLVWLALGCLVAGCGKAPPLEGEPTAEQPKPDPPSALANQPHPQPDRLESHSPTPEKECPDPSDDDHVNEGSGQLDKIDERINKIHADDTAGRGGKAIVSQNTFFEYTVAGVV